MTASSMPQLAYLRMIGNCIHTPKASSCRPGGIPDSERFDGVVRWRRRSGQFRDQSPAWLEVFLAHRDELMAFLKRRAGPRDQAGDLLHDVFLRVARQGSLAQVENPKAYLFRAAANVAIDAARAERHRSKEAVASNAEALDARDPAPDPLQTAIDRDLLRRLDAALAELPEDTRAMIYLLRIDGCSYEGVARLFGLSKSTVEKRVSKAIRHCKARLGFGGDDK